MENRIQSLIKSIGGLIEGTDGNALTVQAAKLAIELENLLEGKAEARRHKRQSYAGIYEQYRRNNSQGDAKIYADGDKDMPIEYDHIEALETGIRAILSTVKDRLKWLELENHNKGL